MRFPGVVWCVVAVVSLSSNGPARGAPASEPLPPTEDAHAQARQHHAAGSKLYDLAEYEAALREFKEAYRAVEDPAFLFNIAQCHRKLGHAQDAVTFYRTYLRRAPHAANRAEVERLIADLERAPAAPPPPVAPAPMTTPPNPPPLAAVSAVPAPTPARDTDPPLLATPVSAPPLAPAETPFYRRRWFWIAAGAVVAGTATTLIVLHERSQSGPFCPDCAGTTAITP